MVVHNPSGQYQPGETSVIPEQSGNFKQMKTKTTDACPQVQSTGQAPEKVPLGDRVIHTFKSILHNIRMSLANSGFASLVPGLLVFLGLGLVTVFPSTVICGGVGGLIKQAKELAGYDSNAFVGGLYIGLYAAVAIAAPAAIITSLAATLGLFCALAPVSTLLKIPKFINQASTMSGEELTQLQVEADEEWSDTVAGALACAKGALNFVT